MKHTQTKGILRRTPTPIRAGKPKRKTPGAYLKRPHLGLMDRLLRSFNQVAPEEWIPSQYLPLLNHNRQTRQLH